MRYEWFIGLRYLKAKRKQTFISIITIISIVGVMVGVMALIVVLAVMSGFEKTLMEKILGTQAHLVLLKANQEGMDDYEELGFPGEEMANYFNSSQQIEDLLSEGQELLVQVSKGEECRLCCSIHFQPGDALFRIKCFRCRHQRH